MNKKCINYMDENNCPKLNCYWNYIKKRCLEQISCELNESEKVCNESHNGN